MWFLFNIILFKFKFNNTLKFPNKMQGRFSWVTSVHPISIYKSDRTSVTGHRQFVTGRFLVMAIVLCRSWKSKSNKRFPLFKKSLVWVCRKTFLKFRFRRKLLIMNWAKQHWYRNVHLFVYSKIGNENLISLTHRGKIWTQAWMETPACDAVFTSCIKCNAIGNKK